MSVANILLTKKIDRVKNIVLAFQYQYPIVLVSIYLELFVLEVIIDYAYASNFATHIVYFQYILAFYATQVNLLCYAFGIAYAYCIFNIY